MAKLESGVNGRSVDKKVRFGLEEKRRRKKMEEEWVVGDGGGKRSLFGKVI